MAATRPASSSPPSMAAPTSRCTCDPARCIMRISMLLTEGDPDRRSGTDRGDDPAPLDDATDADSWRVMAFPRWDVASLLDAAPSDFRSDCAHRG